MKRFILSAALALLATTAGSLTSQVKYTKLVEMDSTGISAPAPSPDGKWIVFAATRDGQAQHLYLAKAAGGTPIELTAGEYYDQQPAWFSDSRRIVFRSTRVGGCMMLSIDPATGRVVDPGRRVTLETAFGCQPTPDAKSIVYSTNNLLPPNEHGGALKMVSLAGGAPRVLDSSAAPGAGFIPGSFSANGSFLYLAVSTHQPEEVRRVRVDGGKPELVRRGSADWVFNGHQPGMFFVGRDVTVGFSLQRTDTLSIESLNGEHIATIDMPWIRRAQFQQPRVATPTSMLVVTDAQPDEARVVPTSGGSPRTLLPGKNAWQSDFLRDGSAVLAVVEGHHVTVDAVPVGGGAPRRLSVPDSESLEKVTSDGRYVFWRNGTTLGVRDLTTSRSVALAHDVANFGTHEALLSSPDDEFTFGKRVGKMIQLSAYQPRTGITRVIATVDPTQAGYTPSFAVRGNLAAYARRSGDSIAIMFTSGGGAPRALVSVRSMHADGIAFSHDGRHMAFALQLIAGVDTSHAIGFADISSDGTPGPPHLVATSNVDGLEWLPDNSAVVYLGILGRNRTAVMKLSPTPGAHPQQITTQEKDPFWEFSVSPDGKWVGYPVEKRERSTIWRVEYGTRR